MKKENSDNGNAPKDTPKRKCTSKQVAAIIGIALLALTDHDTLDGLEEAVRTGSAWGSGCCGAWR